MGWGGYLRPDQFLDHLMVIIKWLKTLIPNRRNGPNILDGHIGGSHCLLWFITNTKVGNRKNKAGQLAILYLSREAQ